MKPLLRAILGLAVLFAFSWIGGEGQRLGLPLPAAVIGLVLLAAILALSERGWRPIAVVRRAMTPVTRRILNHMSLFFVPTGVGLMTQAGLLRRDWLPICAGLLVSTLEALLVSGWLMQRLSPRALDGEP